ncbi:hypothetical protein GCM10011374_40710 [Kocuria dechangensis]|uniref:Uncharacterized protein n=1 Tax=Kocuria dechangensis TaxID=1176249 RepID=A0A917H9D5_9MICC|nr:hypothetical protein [Kocuria dechangensis]GGG71828.1 hypothetical protein GCM10011374_40710 [Kocuria dechangensis]
MTEEYVPIENLEWLRIGDVIEAHRDGVLHHRGTVEETDPRAGAVWIRETSTGQPKMLILGDFDLRCR